MVALAAVFVIRRIPKLAAVGSLVVGVHWEWLLAGGAAEALSILSLSLLQQRLIDATGTAVSFPRMIPITLASNAVAMSIPAGVLVAEGYVFRQYRRVGASRVGAAWAELSAGAIAFAALTLVAFVGSVVVGGELRDILVGPLAIVMVGAALAALLFQRTELLGKLVDRAIRLTQRHAPDSIQTRLYRAQKAVAEMKDIRPEPRVWALGASAAVANWILDTFVLASAILAIGIHVPWSSLLVVYAGAQLLAELPITPGGLGIVEGGLVTMLARSHLPAAPATAAVVLYRGLSFWLLVAVGWVAAARLRASE
ncbi:MAG TPA: lysylphosphatidylglycerol synthase transmembrane domain-containing protein [Acidimicrobiales bacterium]|nr:lysylphosphatidylglycerol synthase transmembrane domain-containing protein [Acidimicrobiales bacterium]